MPAQYLVPLYYYKLVKKCYNCLLIPVDQYRQFRLQTMDTLIIITILFTLINSAVYS